MKMEDRRTCLACGAEFSGAMKFCPVCILRQALDAEGDSGEPALEGEVEPETGPLLHRFEHYELVTGEDGNPIELGRGAMGVTYKALDVDLRCAVTLKVISERYLGDESARLRFLREAGASKPRRISQPKSGTLKAAEGPTSSLLAYKTLFLRSIQAPG